MWVERVVCVWGGGGTGGGGGGGEPGNEASVDVHNA